MTVAPTPTSSTSEPANSVSWSTPRIQDDLGTSFATNWAVLINSLRDSGESVETTNQTANTIESTETRRPENTTAEQTTTTSWANPATGWTNTTNIWANTINQTTASNNNWATPWTTTTNPCQAEGHTSCVCTPNPLDSPRTTEPWPPIDFGHWASNFGEDTTSDD